MLRDFASGTPLSTTRKPPPLGQLGGTLDLLTSLDRQLYLDGSQPFMFSSRAPWAQAEVGLTREASEDIGVLDKNGRINEVVCKFIKAVCRDGGESEESPKVKSDIRVPLHFDQQWR